NSPMAPSEFRCKCDSFSCENQGLHYRFGGIAAGCGPAAQVIVIGLKVASLLPCPVDLRLVQHRQDSADDAARHLILQFKDVDEIPVKAVGPYVPTVGSVDQLTGNPDTTT